MPLLTPNWKRNGPWAKADLSILLIKKRKGNKQAKKKKYCMDACLFQESFAYVFYIFRVISGHDRPIKYVYP